jgi:hypothetical protein
MATQTFPLVPEFAYVVVPQFSTLSTRFENGGVQLRAKVPKPRRTWRLAWKAASPDEAEQLHAFFREMVGGAGEFYYVPSDKTPRPYSAPTMGSTLSGALAGRTRYAKFSWADATNETTPSVNYGTLAVGVNNVLTVTVPTFPSNVTKAWVYVGATSSLFCRQATAITASAGTWTEPDAGYADDGAVPLTTSTLAETVTVHFADDSVEIIKQSAYHYSMNVSLEELL